MNQIYRIAFCFTLFFCHSLLNAQHIQRKASLGIYPAPVSAEVAAEKGLTEAKGVLVNRVLPNSTCSHIGLKTDDIILKINDIEVVGVPELMTARNELRAETKIEMKVWRAGKLLSLKGKGLAIPYENSNSSEVIYDEIPYKDGWLRIIVNKPHADLAIGIDKHPTIFFIPGYTCASVDNFSPIHPYGKLIDSLSGLGYAIFRVEKPGVGDNLNTGDCLQLGFDNELEAYQVAYQHLKDYNFLDLDNIFVFGHSMGGVYAPLMAAEFQPKGVIVYGTTNETWYEYCLKMNRFQNPWMTGDWIQMEKDNRILMRMWYEHFMNKVPTKELAKKPEYDEMLRREYQWDGEDQILGRDEIFWQELHDQNLTIAWAKTPSYTLSIYGEADLPAISSDAHEEIAKIVNTYYPGRAEYQLLEGTDHSLIRVGSMEDYLKLRQTPAYREKLENHFNYDLVTMMDVWIKDKLDRSLGNGKSG